MKIDKINNFNIIRLLASIQVVVFHGLEHLHIDSIWLNFFNRHFLRFFPGVPIFFFISGFLIYWSFERNSTEIRQYIKNRILRIYPALWVCVLVTTFLLLLFSENQIDLLTNNNFYLWIAGHFTFFQFYTPDILRFWGVGAPNGSLWTIIVELQFYFLIPIIYFLTKKSKLTLYFFILLSIIFNIFIDTLDFENIIRKVGGIFVMPYLYYFMFGVIFYIHWAKIKSIVENKFLIWFLIYFSWSILMNNYFGIETSSYWIDSPINLISDIILLFMVFAAATSNKKLSSKILKSNDISYGIYIYHMLVINSFIELGLIENPYYLVLALVITIILSYFSWVYIESKALKFKKIKLIDYKT